MVASTHPMPLSRFIQVCPEKDWQLHACASEVCWGWLCVHQRMIQPAVENLDGRMEVFVCGRMWEMIPRLIFSSIIGRF